MIYAQLLIVFVEYVLCAQLSEGECDEDEHEDGQHEDNGGDVTRMQMKTSSTRMAITGGRGGPGGKDR